MKNIRKNAGSPPKGAVDLEHLWLQLPQIMALLGHRHVDIMKLDIECAEYGYGLIEAICGNARPMHLAFELHGHLGDYCRREHMIHLFNELHRCGYRRIWQLSKGSKKGWEFCQEEPWFCEVGCVHDPDMMFYMEVSYLRIEP